MSYRRKRTRGESAGEVRGREGEEEDREEG